MPVVKETEANAKSIADAFNTDIRNVEVALAIWYNNSYNLPGQKSQLPLSLLDTPASVSSMNYNSIINSSPYDGQGHGRVAADFINNVMIPFVRVLSKVRTIKYSEIYIDAWGNRNVEYTQTGVGILKATTNVSFDVRKIKRGQQMNLADNMNDFITYIKSIIDSNRINNIYNYEYVTQHTNHWNHSNRGRR